MKNKEFIVAGIKNLLKRNYRIDPNTIDIESYVDTTLTFYENWNEIKGMINLNELSYDFLRCNNCEKKISGDWNYCCDCGGKLK